MTSKENALGEFLDKEHFLQNVQHRRVLCQPRNGFLINKQNKLLKLQVNKLSTHFGSIIFDNLGHP